MGTFDADQFSQMETQGSNDTKYVPIPEADYPAVVDKIAFRETDKGSVVLDVTWKIDSQQAAEATGIKEPQARQSIFIDRTESGGLDMGKGKNVKLGQLREALGLNQAGQPFSFNMLVGRPGIVKIKHRKVDDDTFTDVKSVAKVG